MRLGRREWLYLMSKMSRTTHLLFEILMLGVLVGLRGFLALAVACREADEVFACLLGKRRLGILVVVCDGLEVGWSAFAKLTVW